MVKLAEKKIQIKQQQKYVVTRTIVMAIDFFTLTCIPVTLQVAQGIRMNVFEAPGRNTNSDAAFIAREISLRLPLLARI